VTRRSVERHQVEASAPLNQVSVVVPVRNAAKMLDECLASIATQGVHEVIVVDGMSADGSRDVAANHGARVISDGGRGLAAARMLGVETASTQWVALIDADVVLHDGALQRLFLEYRNNGYLALQAGLRSTSGPGYWGRALTFHHHTGLSRNWFGVVATVVERDVLLLHGFDSRFLSGEDIDLRWRLRQHGKVGVSKETIVEHRFGEDTFDFARAQFLMDGEGIGRMLAKRRLRAAHLVALPAAAGSRGVFVSALHRRPSFIAYFLAFTVYNYVGILRALRTR
jgi:glycosyltransferase involved in cell wall biosynthesis